MFNLDYLINNKISRISLKFIILLVNTPSSIAVPILPQPMNKTGNLITEFTKPHLVFLIMMLP